MVKSKWTLCGVPMTAQQIAAVKKAQAAGEQRIYLESTDEQKQAYKVAASEADAELKEMAAEFRSRPRFAVTMRTRRKELGITLDELAESTGISKANLSRLECGRTTNPTLDTLQRIGEGLSLVLTVDYSAAR